MESKNFNWRPVSEYTGGRVLATNGLDVLIGEINSEGDCENEEDGSTILCGITGFIKIEEMLPELKESEDERVMRELIDFFGGTLNGEDVEFPSKDTMERWVAWLEKQKERSPLSKDEEYTLARIIEYLEDNDCPSEWKDLLHDIYALPYQKVKNPAWSKEDEQYLLVCKNALAKYQRTDKWDASIISRWLESLKDKVQPKQEWSEEDEKMLRGIIDDFSDELDEWTNKEEIEIITNKISFLKSLKPQPIHKWDREDNKIKLEITDYLECQKREEPTRIAILNKWIAWIANLDPQGKKGSQWKPSDEQIKAVKEAACYSSVFSDKTIDNLISLSKQLKKLREE